MAECIWSLACNWSLLIAVSSQMQHTQCLSLKTVLNVLVDSRALVILIVSQSVSGSVCQCRVFFQNASSPAVLVGIRCYCNNVLLCCVFLMDGWSRLMMSVMYHKVHTLRCFASCIRGSVRQDRISISGMCPPVDFLFDSSVRSSGLADWMDLLTVGPANPKWRLATVLKMSNLS